MPPAATNACTHVHTPRHTHKKGKPLERIMAQRQCYCSASLCALPPGHYRARSPPLARSQTHPLFPTSAGSLWHRDMKWSGILYGHFKGWSWRSNGSTAMPVSPHCEHLPIFLVIINRNFLRMQKEGCTCWLPHHSHERAAWDYRRRCSQQIVMTEDSGVGTTVATSITAVYRPQCQKTTAARWLPAISWFYWPLNQNL